MVISFLALTLARLGDRAKNQQGVGRIGQVRIGMVAHFAALDRQVACVVLVFAHPV
jgi:predicted amidohydrolase YtcJ